MDLTVDLIEFVVLVDIIDTIIGNIFFHNDKQLFNDSNSDDDTMVVEAIVKKAAKKSKEKVNDMKLYVKQFDKLTYKVTIKNVTRFELAMDHVSISMLFRQIVATIQ